METPLLNIIDSPFEHVFHLYGLDLVSTYKYECNFLYLYILFIG
jgi:hypothetical protein